MRMHTLFHLVLVGYLLGNWVPPTFPAQCLCVILTNSIHTTMWQLRYTMLTTVNCLIFSNHASTCNTHPQYRLALGSSKSGHRTCIYFYCCLLLICIVDTSVMVGTSRVTVLDFKVNSPCYIRSCLSVIRAPTVLGRRQWRKLSSPTQVLNFKTIT